LVGGIKKPLILAPKSNTSPTVVVAGGVKLAPLGKAEMVINCVLSGALATNLEFCTEPLWSKPSAPPPDPSSVPV
jgi:hypothetical protein